MPLIHLNRQNSFNLQEGLATAQMKMCCWVSFGIYNTWHRPPVAENWLGRHCRAKLLPAQQ